MAALGADPTIRRQVMAAAREALSQDPGAPIDTIARRAGVSRATFYRHFGSREALLASVAHEPRPSARQRILTAAREMLIHTSLADLSMEDLARASDVSRGTLYRLFPGKAALLEGLIQAYSPFEQIRAVMAAHGDEPPEIVFQLIARAVSGAAGEQLGLMRVVFVEVTSGSVTAMSGMRPGFATVLGVLVDYVAAQMAAGRIRKMHPLVALQSLIGPIFFHLMTRPAVQHVTEMELTPQQAVDQLVAVALAGLRPEPAR